MNSKTCDGISLTSTVLACTFGIAAVRWPYAGIVAAAFSFLAYWFSRQSSKLLENRIESNPKRG
jgi:hypothetical protein